MGVFFSNTNPKTRESQGDLGKNVCACVVWFVGGREMGGAAFLQEPPVILVISALFLHLIDKKRACFFVNKKKMNSGCFLSFFFFAD